MNDDREKFVASSGAPLRVPCVCLRKRGDEMSKLIGVQIFCTVRPWVFAGIRFIQRHPWAFAWIGDERIARVIIRFGVRVSVA